MPESPERQEPERETMTIPKLAERVGRSRTLIHRLATNPAEGWPAPVFPPDAELPPVPVLPDRPEVVVFPAGAFAVGSITKYQ